MRLFLGGNSFVLHLGRDLAFPHQWNNANDLNDSSCNEERGGSKAQVEASSGSGNKGQATDCHSLAERVRREKISERMKILQDLVRGCNKVVIGKARVLDEIINYIQSLQRQVEFLSVVNEALKQKIQGWIRQ